MKFQFHFWLDPYFSGGLSSIWLAQAYRVFTTLSIPEDEWNDCGLCLHHHWDRYLYMVILDIEVSAPEETNNSLTTHNGPNLPHYLFVRPPPRFSDGFPDISNWRSGKDLYYWSHSPNGIPFPPEHPEMALSKDADVALSLPNVVPEVHPLMHTWSLDAYNLMRKLQEAKGFDPTTTDFALSKGYPLLDIISAGEERFEDISKDTGALYFPGRNL
ncbi:hypothetical protein L218DRAFT_886410 [Marasmius fiardii PR-910]|nr:hypothetical protein L218DRAFT_886410 [Marasmius fiardii PR-910]